MKRLFVLFAALLCLGLGVVVVWELLMDPSQAPEGSLIWRLRAPALLAQAPTPGLCAPRFYSAAGRDGERPGMDRIDFGSTASRAELKQALTAHFSAMGCAAASAGEWACPKEGRVGLSETLGTSDASCRLLRLELLW